MRCLVNFNTTIFNEILQKTDQKKYIAIASGVYMKNQWSLGDLSNQQVESNLSLTLLIEKIQQSLDSGVSEQDIVIWQPEWRDWKCFKDVPEIKNEIQKLMNQSAKDLPPPLPKITVPPLPSISNSNSNSNNNLLKKNMQRATENIQSQNLKSEPKPIKPENTITRSNETFIQKRKHPRIFARLRCIIRTETITFRTFTQDISLGGVSLEDEIPQDLIGKQCSLYISSPKIKTNLKFHIDLTERCVAKFFSFHDAPSSIIDQLALWIKDLDKNSKAS